MIKILASSLVTASKSYGKRKEKTVDKISQAVLKSLPEELYGTININIKGLE